MIHRASKPETVSILVVALATGDTHSSLTRYDPDRVGYLDHQEFLKRLGVNFAPGDDGGVSRVIVDNSEQTMDDHHANMVMKHEIQTYNQANAVWSMPVQQIFIQLR